MDIGEQLSELDLYLTYDGYLSDRDVKNILALIEDDGYVKLAEDKSLPEVPDSPIYSDKPYTDAEKQAFRAGTLVYRNVIAKAGWKLPEPTELTKLGYMDADTYRD